MIQISVYKGNELITKFESPVVPPAKELLWINDSDVFYTVTSAIYKVDTERRRLKVDLMVE